MNRVIRPVWFKHYSSWLGLILWFKHSLEQGFPLWWVHQLHSPYLCCRSSRIWPMKTLQMSMMYEVLNIDLFETGTKKKKKNHCCIICKLWKITTSFPFLVSTNISLMLLIILQISWSHWYGWLQRFTHTMRTIQGSLIVSSFVNIILGFSFAWGNLTR